MHPDPPPCARCGHSLWQHSTGECDIARCPCKGWMASLGQYPPPRDWLAIGLYLLAFVCGVLIAVVLP